MTSHFRAVEGVFLGIYVRIINENKKSAYIIFNI